MRSFRAPCRLSLAASLVTVWTALNMAPALADDANSSWRRPYPRESYLISDNIDLTGNDDVKQFDARSNAYLGPFTTKRLVKIIGPGGLIFVDGDLYLVNQNAQQDNTAGEVLRFDGRNGMYMGKLVSSTDRGAPFAPRAIVYGGPDRDFFVTDQGEEKGCISDGSIRQYGDRGDPRSRFGVRGFYDQFHPRGIVFGPDGFLYVSVVSCLDESDPSYTRGDRGHGYIMRFDARTKRYVDTFASHARVPNLHRPDGLTFDKDGNLWVTSFRLDDLPDKMQYPPNNVDRILKIDGKTGKQIGEIRLWNEGDARVYSQGIVFGPDGYLYVPVISGDSDLNGTVRRCDTRKMTCDVVVGAGSPLAMPQYIIFGGTNPATLQYGE
jgi:sugar lactone lactonase YvrE